MQEKVLLFNFYDKKQLQYIKAVFYQVQVPIALVPTERYGVPIRELVKSETSLQPVKSKGQELEGQMIVFAGLLDRKLDKAIYLLRNNPGCGKIPYKAVVTKTNQKWDVYTLFNELNKEHAAMHKKD